MFKDGTKKFFFICLALLFLFSCNAKKNKTEGNGQADSTSVAKTNSPADLVTEKIKADPNNPELYNTRAKYYLAEKKFTPATNDINKAISLDSILYY